MGSSRRSLLAEMALRFVEQREVLATASLGHILASSPVARDGLRAWLAERAVTVPADLQYSTEVVKADREGRPDLVGALGNERYLIVEGKFWAGLTESQPVGYLRSLEEGGCLLFVAPELRFQTVGAELVLRCKREGLGVTDGSAILRGGLSQVNGWSLGMVSWRSLLGRLNAALMDHREAGLAADVEQLLGLAELEDQDAFLPVSSADLATPTPRRVRQFMELVNDVCERGVAVGTLRRAGLRPASSLGRYTRYIAAGPIQLAVYADLRRWAEQRMTPLWAEAAVDPGTALADLLAETPPGVFFDGHQGRPTIPLEIPLYVERDAIIDSLVQQLNAFVDRIEGCTPTVAVRSDPDTEV
jgi:hypothetical protein